MPNPDLAGELPDFLARFGERGKVRGRAREGVEKEEKGRGKRRERTIWRKGEFVLWRRVCC